MNPGLCKVNLSHISCGALTGPCCVTVPPFGASVPFTVNDQLLGMISCCESWEGKLLRTGVQMSEKAGKGGRTREEGGGMAARDGISGLESGGQRFTEHSRAWLKVGIGPKRTEYKENLLAIPLPFPSR